MKVELRQFDDGRREILVRAEGALSDRAQYEAECELFQSLARGIAVVADFGNALLIRKRIPDDDT